MLLGVPSVCLFIIMQVKSRPLLSLLLSRPEGASFGVGPFSRQVGGLLSAVVRALSVVNIEVILVLALVGDDPRVTVIVRLKFVVAVAPLVASISTCLLGVAASKVNLAAVDVLDRTYMLLGRLGATALRF